MDDLSNSSAETLDPMVRKLIQLYRRSRRKVSELDMHVFTDGTHQEDMFTGGFLPILDLIPDNLKRKHFCVHTSSSLCGNVGDPGVWMQEAPSAETIEQYFVFEYDILGNVRGDLHLTYKCETHMTPGARMKTNLQILSLDATYLVIYVGQVEHRIPRDLHFATGNGKLNSFVVRHGQGALRGHYRTVVVVSDSLLMDCDDATQSHICLSESEDWNCERVLKGGSLYLASFKLS